MIPDSFTIIEWTGHLPLKIKLIRQLLKLKAFHYCLQGKYTKVFHLKLITAYIHVPE